MAESIIDQRTVNRNYTLPNVDNTLQTDVGRIRSAMGAIDEDVNSLFVNYTPANVLAMLLTVDGPSSGISVQYLGGQEATYFAASSTLAAHIGSGGGAHAAATTATAGFMDSASVTKLAGIEAGAQANTVASVQGKVGVVTLSASDISAAPSTHVGSGGTAHATVTSVSAGFMTASDKSALDSASSTLRVSHQFFLRG